MNIQDSEDLKNVEVDALEFLLDSQRELVEKYKVIEGMPDPPMDINTKETQIWVKDFLWRVTEELMEAYEAYSDGDNEHYLEELSDALHFYLEVFILIDHYPRFDDVLLETMISRAPDDISDSIGDLMLLVVYHMGLAANFLRNKKWKQTQVFVDKDRFYEELDLGFYDLIDLLIVSGIGCKYDLLNLYYKKFQVNQFRQRSRY